MFFTFDKLAFDIHGSAQDMWLDVSCWCQNVAIYFMYMYSFFIPNYFIVFTLKIYSDIWISTI